MFYKLFTKRTIWGVARVGFGMVFSQCHSCSIAAEVVDVLVTVGSCILEQPDLNFFKELFISDSPCFEALTIFEEIIVNDWGGKVICLGARNSIKWDCWDLIQKVCGLTVENVSTLPGAGSVFILLFRARVCIR